MCVPAGGVAAIGPVTDAYPAAVRRRHPRPADYLTHRPDAQSVEDDEIKAHRDAEHQGELDPGDVKEPLHPRPAHPGCATDHDGTDAREDHGVHDRRGTPSWRRRAAQGFECGGRVCLAGDERPESLERGLGCAFPHRGQRIFRTRQVLFDGTERLLRWKAHRACKSAHVRASVYTGGQVLESTFVNSGGHYGIQSGGRADVGQGNAFLHTSTMKFEPIGHGEPPYHAIGRCRQVDYLSH